MSLLLALVKMIFNIDNVCYLLSPQPGIDAHMRGHSWRSSFPTVSSTHKSILPGSWLETDVLASCTEQYAYVSLKDYVSLPYC